MSPRHTQFETNDSSINENILNKATPGDAAYFGIKRKSNFSEITKHKSTGLSSPHSNRFYEQFQKLITLNQCMDVSIKPPVVPKLRNIGSVVDGGKNF